MPLLTQHFYPKLFLTSRPFRALGPLRLKLLERVSLHVGLVFIPIFASVAAGTLRIFGHAKSDATMLRAMLGAMLVYWEQCRYAGVVSCAKSGAGALRA